MNDQELIELSPTEREARISKIEHDMHKMFKSGMTETKREQLQLIIDRERALADKQRNSED